MIYLSSGLKSKFQMAEFNLHRNWKWVGPLLWLTIHYDHVFSAESNRQTKLAWVVEVEGFGVSIFGKLFAMIYNRNLNKAIPRLIAEMNSLEH